MAWIYRPYVETTAITFEEEPPAPESIASDIETRLDTYPWFVAEADDGVLGYAYAAPLRKRDAYRWTVELSVYVDRDRRRRGLGSALYTALLETLERQGFESAYGVVTLPNPESAGFHEALGFERVGLFPKAGYKLGEWHDVAWYQRSLGARSASPSEPIPFEACRDEPWLDELLTPM
ncbi:MAG: N-acetyltransferase family protein [Halobacteriota archaeon]